MIPHPRPLLEVFADIPDVRNRRGTRHPLPSILALACCAMLCGARSYSAIAEWGRNYGSRIAQALGFRHIPPCAATLHLIFRRLDCAGFEAQLGAWAESVVASTPGGTDRPQAVEPAVALDGKTLRGSRKQGAPGVHLLSALAHQVGVTLAQQAVADKTNEITAVETVLGQLVLAGRVVTMDALLTQTAVAQTIVDAGGDYVMIVKANQPQLRSDIELIFAEPPVGDHQETAATLDLGHGRIEQRRLTTSQALAGYSAWPGLAQVFALERSVITLKTGEVRSETVYGVTSLACQRAAPSRVLELVRGHWQIENQSHWVRDVTFDEDRSQVRCGNIPQVMAALRNATIGLLRWAGYSNMAAAGRLLAAQPVRALALIGIQLEN
jgi:predicted transposase YbfD/YdcC